MYYLYILCSIISIISSTAIRRKVSGPSGIKLFDGLTDLVKILPPDSEGKSKGETGKVCVIGGAVQHSGPPYFSAISALKVGADVVTVITQNETSPVVKAYSPDLVVYPYLNPDTASKIAPIIKRYDVIVIGPGLGEEEETIPLTYDVINTCKIYEKPIVIDAGGLFALSKNPTILKNYPGPVILTPNQGEADLLVKGMALTDDHKGNWYDYWGSNVTVLLKGKTDKFYSSQEGLNWFSNDGGSVRRTPGQGNVVAGTLGIFFNWALKNEVFIKDKSSYPTLSQSVASYAAAKVTRYANGRAFQKYGSSFVTSDMVDNLHFAFEDVFGSSSR